MKRRTQIAILVVVVVLVGLAAWWRLRGRGSDEDTRSAASTGGSSDSVVTKTGGGAAARPGPVVPASVSGRVVKRAGGAGIAGARVSLARAELGAAIFEGGDTPTVHVITDAQGAFTATGVAPGAYVIGAAAKGFIPGSHDKLVIGSGARTTGIEIALDAGGTTLSGTVSDVGGGPVAGAEVTVTAQKISLRASPQLIAIAGDDGRYELTLADGEYSASASHADYTTDSKGFELVGKPMTVDFTLIPGASIRGQVITRDGTPLPDALVDAESGKSTRSDAQGKFTLKSLDAGAISVTAKGRGYASTAPTVVEVGIGEQVDDVKVIVDRAYTISGTVVEQGTTKGIAGIRLGVFSMSGETAFALAPSGVDGSWEILGVRPASYMMFALGEEVMPEVGKQVVVVDKDISDVVVEMAGGVSLSGRVEPPALASISIMPLSVGIGNIFEVAKTALVRGESDATGAFTLRHVPAGSFNLTASTKDGLGGKIVVMVEKVDKTGVVVPLEQRASVAGRVVDVRGGPVAGAKVSASKVRDKDGSSSSFSFDMGGRGGVVTGADGSFKVVGFDAGKIELKVHDDGGQLRWADAAHKDKPRAGIEVELGKGEARTGVTLTVETRDGVIRGNVVGVDRQPAADAWVTARLVEVKAEAKEEDEDAMAAILGNVNRSKPVLSGADGSFVIEKLARGSYEVVAETARGTARAAKPGVKTGDTVTLVLAPLGTLTGRVTAGGEPVPDFDLTCKGPKAAFTDDIDRHVTDKTGAYKLERLAPADYTCTVTADAGRVTATVKVPSGEAKLDLVLAPWATITGKIVSALSGAPVPGVKVMIGGDNFDAAAIGDLLTGGGPTSDAAGKFTLPRVPPGKGELVVMPKEGGFQQLAKREFEATSGQRLDLGTIKVVPPRTGEAGTLGMGTDITDGALVVSSVKPGGPAEGAGVRVGDKIVTISGAPVAELTPALAQTLLASGTIGVGQSFQLGVDRAGTAVQITIIAVAW